MTAVTSSSLINNASLRSLGEESRLSAELQMTPLTVCKQTPLSEVVALMSRDRQICNLTCDVIPSTFATRPSQEYSPERSSLVLSCVVVVEDGKPIGIFTGRDLVRLAATGRTIGNQTVEDVMTRSPITITQEQATNLFAVVTILQEHRIRHLAVVNAAGKLVGLLTHEGIRQSLQPSDLLRLQSVAESLTRDVTQATATTTLQAIAQLMTQYQVSCVVITETIQGKTRPLGIITEGDIVQYQSLQLDFAQLAAQIVMSHPVFCATPNLNLWQAHQLMLEHRITHLVITHADGALAGILPQTTILKSLNPAEMFEVIGILQEQVERLEAEKLELLESRNVELQQAVNLKTADLAQQNEFERLLVDINNRIRSSLNFDTVLATAVETLQEALQVDRALVYRFHPDWSGRVVIESVSATQWSLLNQELGNSCFQHPAAEKYRHKPVRAITNIYDANLQDCYVEFLEQLDVKSHVVAAIWHDEQLWGLLVLHNCRAIRHWHDREIELVRKVSDQLTIALRQANTHESLQSELAARQQAEIRLRESEQRYASLAAVVPVVIFRANISGACIYINEYWTTLTGMSREDALSQGWTQVIHPEDLEDVMIAWQKAIQTGKRFQLEYRLQLPNGPIKWVYEQAEPEWDVTGKICGYVGSLIDISDRKQAELALRESEQRFRRAIAEAPVPIMIHAEDGEILQISSTWTDLTGYSHADIPTIQAWTKRAYGEKATSIVANVIAQQYSLQSRCEEGEFLINTANGLQRIWSFSSASLGKLPDGRRIAIAMAADVTEQQKAKVALQASESRYRALVEVIPDLMIRQDAEGNYLDLVMSDEIRFIKPDSAHIGINVYNLLPLELAQQRMAYVHRALQTGEVQIYDFEIDIEGDRRWQESRILAINQTEVLVIVRDISQRKQTELALRESEQRFRRAIADAPFPIMIHAEDGEVLQINSTWTNLTGYTQSDIPTLQTWAELTYNDQADSMIAKTLTKNCGLNSRWEECELTIKTSKGGTRIWSLSSAPLGSLPDGRQIAVSMAADITERQQTQAALQASERRYRALVEVIPDLMIRQDSQGNYLDLVTSSEIQLVRPDRTHIGNNIYELMPLDLAQQRMTYVHQALQTGEVQIYEFQIEMAGEQRWEEARVVAINKSEVLVIVRDINERKQAEAQLQSTSQRLQEAQRIAHLGNWELNIQTNHLYWSDEVFRIFAIDQNQFGASYEAFIEAIHPDDREMVNQAYQQHVQDGIPYNIVHRLLMPDGRIKYVQEQGETLQDVDGTAILSRGTVLDITTLKDAEQKRQEAEASLRQIVEGTAAVTECDFFQELVQHIAAALDVRYTSISEATSDGFAILAFCADGQLQRVDDCLYNQVPCCLQALQDGQCCHPDSLPNLYPDNELFSALNAESYLGIGLRNSTGEPIGNLCIMHDRPLHNPEGIINLLKIFGARAGAELERYQTARQLQKLTTELEQRVVERTATLAATVEHLQTEVKQRQILEVQLLQSQAQLQDLFDNANDMIQSVSLMDGSFEFVNRAWLETLGYDTQELERLNIFDVLHPNCQEHCMTLMQHLKTGQMQSLDRVEIRFVAKDGRIIEVEGSVNSRITDGKAISTRGIFRDITARKQAEKSLAENQQQLAKQLASIEAAVDGIAILEADCFQYLNPAHVSMFGYEDASDLIGHSWHKLYDPGEMKRFEYEIFPILQRDRAWQGETVATRKDGSTFAQGISLTLTDENLLICVCQDISDRKAAEAELYDLSTRLSLAVKSGGIGIWEWDFIHEQLTWDNRMHELYGIQPEAFTGGFTDWSTRVHPDDLAEAQAQFQQAIAEQKELDIEFRIIRPNGQVRYIKANGLLQRNAKGEPLRIMGINFDTSDRKQAEADILTALEHERELSEMKSRFVSNASHEFRTPLTVISSNTELLKLFGDKLDDAERKECLDTILSYVEHTTELIDDVLVVSRAESGRIELNKKLLDVVEFSQSLGQTISLSGPKHHFEFVMQDHRPQSGNYSNRAQLDSKILQQILTNLLTNAIKYSPEGSTVTLRLELFLNKIELSVIDEGIGIPEADQEHLFEPFQRATNVGSISGTGLGLSIVKSFVTLHKGEIKVKSTPEKGSCFTIQIPTQWQEKNSKLQ